MAADEAADSKEVKTESKPSVASGKNPLLTIVVILQTVLMGGVAFMQYQLHQAQSSQPSLKDIIKAEMKVAKEGDVSETGEAREEDGILFPLANFTANLAQGDGPRRFIRLNVVIKFSKDSKEEEFKSRKPQIRDVIIGQLNRKRPEDLLVPEGKKYLKEEVKAAINGFLVDGHVIDIYLTGFQIK